MPRLLLAALAAAAAGEVVEPRTGIKFADKRGGSSLSRLGVRTKGPIKVYAVGEYEDGTYVLKMSYGVGANKMVGALGDALKPRCSDAGSVEEFEACLLQGLPDGAPKGTTMAFATGGGKLGVTVNEKRVGTVGSRPLAEAFANIYSDSKAVCTMNAVLADDGEQGAAVAAGGCQLTPQRGAKVGAAVGAALGYGIGKVFGVPDAE